MALYSSSRQTRTCSVDESERSSFSSKISGSDVVEVDDEVEDVADWRSWGAASSDRLDLISCESSFRSFLETSSVNIIDMCRGSRLFFFMVETILCCMRDMSN